MIHTILFDLDGTLIDSWNLYIEAYRLTVQPYVRKPLTEEDIERTKPSSELRFIELTVPEKERDHAFKRFITHYSSLYDDLIGNFYEGINETIEQLKEQNFKVGIVTGKSHQAWNVTKRKSGFPEFDIVITGNDVNNYKPYPEGIFKAMEKLNSTNEETLYVGDSLVDQKSAIGAEVHFAAALWSKSNDELDEFIDEIKQNGSNIFLEKPGDLLTLEHLK